MPNALSRVLSVLVSRAPQTHIPVWRRVRPRLLAWLSLVGVAAFVLAILVLHLTAFRQGPVHLSEFANTPFSPLWSLGIYSYTIAGVALSLAVRAHLGQSLFRRTGVSMIWIAIACAVLLAIVPMDGTNATETVQGIIHVGAAISMFTFLGAAMMAFAPAFRTDPTWRGMGLPSLVLGILVNAFGVAYLITALDGLDFAGVAQRLMVVLIVTWSVLVAMRLLQVSRLRSMQQRHARLHPRGADGRFVSTRPGQAPQ